MGDEIDREASILESVKAALGLPANYPHFDVPIKMHINTAFDTLRQLGVGPADGFSIKDETATWSDFMDEGVDLDGVKTYIYTKVRYIFDPPSSSVVMEAMKETMRELEWRLNVEVEHGTGEVDG